MSNPIFLLAAAALLGSGAAASAANFVISTSPGLFDPEFRGGAGATWFGWTSGSYDAEVGDPTNHNENIINPPATIGSATGYSLARQGLADTLSGSNNIYSMTDFVLDLGVPTDGTNGAGFTTIVLQGRTLFGPFSGSLTFPDVGGVSPTVVYGANSAGSGQSWAKYELSGNSSLYNLSLGILAHTSISELEVDTKWASAAFSSDTASAVPEASGAALTLAAMTGMVMRRRRPLVG